MITPMGTITGTSTTITMAIAMIMGIIMLIRVASVAFCSH